MVQSEIMIHANKLDFMLYKHESYQIIKNIALSKQEKQNGTI
jgi:hypothetical protein